MINLEKAKEEFLKYTSNYDVEHPKIHKKITHSLRVCDISGKIAEGLNLDNEQIELAKLIGLLHDIARFEQFTRFGTYNDLVSIDHGQLGVEILENDQYIRKYIETEKFDNTIKKAIKNHNAYRIEDGLNEEEILHSKIIRDSDKIDILYQISEFYKKGEDRYLDEEKISQEVYEQFYNKQIIDNRYKITKLDGIIGVISFIYDIYFKESFEIIKEKDYMNKIIDRFEVENAEVKKQLEEIKKVTNEYIEQKTK